MRIARGVQTSMTTDQERELVQASRADSFLERLAEKLGAHARASAVFGEPVERDGVTVIPVAKARWGFGGGGGRKAKDGEEGSGGGGGMVITPIGYIELKGGDSRFRPIHHAAARLPLLIAGGIIALRLLRRLR